MYKYSYYLRDSSYFLCCCGHKKPTVPAFQFNLSVVKILRDTATAARDLRQYIICVVIFKSFSSLSRPTCSRGLYVNTKQINTHFFMNLSFFLFSPFSSSRRCSSVFFNIHFQSVFLTSLSFLLCLYFLSYSSLFLLILLPFFFAVFVLFLFFLFDLILFLQFLTFFLISIGRLYYFVFFCSYLFCLFSSFLFFSSSHSYRTFLYFTCWPFETHN